MTKNPHFDSLYRSVSSPLYKFIAKHLRRDQTAVEEVFEETIVAGWKGYKTFEHKSSSVGDGKVSTLSACNAEIQNII